VEREGKGKEKKKKKEKHLHLFPLPAQRMGEKGNKALSMPNQGKKKQGKKRPSELI